VCKRNGYGTYTGKRPLTKVDLNERIILKWLLERQIGLVRIKLIQLRMWASGNTCKHGIEASRSAKYWEDLEWQGDS
jgi:hypothetical protein